MLGKIPEKTLSGMVQESILPWGIPALPFRRKFPFANLLLPFVDLPAVCYRLPSKKGIVAGVAVTGVAPVTTIMNPCCFQRCHYPSDGFNYQLVHVSHVFPSFEFNPRMQEINFSFPSHVCRFVCYG